MNIFIFWISSCQLFQLQPECFKIWQLFHDNLKNKKLYNYKNNNRHWDTQNKSILQIPTLRLTKERFKIKSQQKVHFKQSFLIQCHHQALVQYIVDSLFSTLSFHLGKLDAINTKQSKMDQIHQKFNFHVPFLHYFSFQFRIQGIIMKLIKNIMVHSFKHK